MLEPIDLPSAFRTAGLRSTPQRRAMLRYLSDQPVHATAEEIFVAVNRTDPRASRATVYNNLRALEGAGLVREVVSEGKAARFDVNFHRHHHFLCEGCGAVEDIEWFDLPAAACGALGARRVRHFDIVFRGLCGACRRKDEVSGDSR
ncbi:MAG: Fur family transcriptional regulator [Bryobacteraceae bacterium]